MLYRFPFCNDVVGAGVKTATIHVWPTFYKKKGLFFSIYLLVKKKGTEKMLENEREFREKSVAQQNAVFLN